MNRSTALAERPDDVAPLVGPGVALIFDMDGVIIHSTPLHTLAWQIYLERLGIPSDGILQRMHGKRNDQIVTDIFGDSLSSAEVSEHGFAKERLYRELMANRIHENLVPGLQELLDQTQGVPRGLATNAEPLNVDFVLDGAGIRHHFQAVVHGHQVSRPKPDPEVFLRVAALLGYAAANCVIFEDSPSGIIAARAAGARVVALETTRCGFPEADLCIPDFRDPRLLPWLAQQRPLAAS